MQVADLFVSSSRETETQRRPFLLTPCAAMEEVRLVIAGQSHMHALARALVTAPLAGEVVDPAAIARTHGIAGLMGGQHTSEFRNLLLHLAQDRDLALSWRGNQHNGDFLIMPGTVLEVLPRGYPDRSVLPGAQLVAESAIRAHLQPSMDEMTALLRDIAHPGRRHFVLGSPPPLGDQALVRLRLSREPAFVQRAQALGIDVQVIGLAPASVRRKLWFVVQRQMAETAAANGAVFVPHPAASEDEQGFLRTDMSGGDITHANERYGRLMLGQLATVLAQRPPQAPLAQAGPAQTGPAQAAAPRVAAA
jgi:hypothetical protein